MTDRAALLDLLLADLLRSEKVPRDEAVVLLAQMAAIQPVLVARIVAATPAPDGIPAAPGPPDRLLTVEDVAERLGMTVRMVYRRAHRWPFTRKVSPRALRFSERGLCDYMATKPLDGRPRRVS